MDDSSVVYLVGSGPGDPDLLTVKALRILNSADVVVYDRLVSQPILDLIPVGIPRISVGKRPGAHSVSQEEINDLLAALTAHSRRIVRLKGGDPFVFGRGSEEAVYLRQHGIRFEVVPGITAASACCTYAGIPLTHRGLSRRVLFLSGHFQNDEPFELDWSSSDSEETTIVIYMGLANVEKITDALIAGGVNRDIPAAAIQDGTTPRQIKLVSTLAKLAGDIRERGMTAPVMLVIGQVVTLSRQLDFYSCLDGLEHRIDEPQLSQRAG